MTDTPETHRCSHQIGPAEIAALVLLGGIPPVYFPGFTFEYTYLKLPLFQIVALTGLVALALHAARPAAWLRQRLVLIAPPALLVLWMFASVAWHSYPWAAARSLVRETTFLAGFVGLSFLLTTAATRKLFARWLAAAAVVASVFIIVFLSTGAVNYFGNRNFAGGFLVLPITAMLAFLLGPSGSLPGRRYWGLVGGTFVMLYALWLTNSHGALAGVVLGGVLVCFVFFKTARRYLTTAGAVAVVAAGGLALSEPGIVERTLGIRAYIWAGASKLIASAPFLGHGVGAFVGAIRPLQPLEYFAHPAAAPITWHAHNYPLEIAAELGAAGLVLYGGLLAGLFLSARRAVRNAGDAFDRCVLVGIACGLAGMVLQGLVSIGPAFPDVQINFWLGAAFICGAMGSGHVRMPIRARRLPGAVALVAVFVVAFYFLSWKGFQAQRWVSRAVRQQQPAARLAMLKKAKLAQPFEDRLSVEIRMKLAEVYFALNQLDSALAEYMEIEGLSPNFGGIDANIAHVHQLVGNYAAAAEYAERAAREDPFDVRIYAIWLNALRSGAREPSAAPAVELLSLCERVKAFAPALHRLSNRGKGEPFDEKFFYYTLNIPAGVRLQADFREHAGEREEAARLYARASEQCAALAEIVVGQPQAAVDLFRLWHEIGSESGQQAIFARAAKALSALLSASPKEELVRMPKELYYFLGAMYYKSDDRERGTRQLKEVALFCQRLLRPGQPDHPRVLELLARVYEVLNPSLSLEIAGKLLQQDPHNQAARQLIFTLTRRPDGSMQTPQPEPFNGDTHKAGSP